MAGISLHPDVAQLLSDMKAAGIPAPSAGTPQTARALLLQLRPARRDAPPMKAIDDVLIPAATPLRMRIYEPVDRPEATILFFHGGGWVIGDIESSDFAVRHLAVASGLRLCSLDYRLAPEHPFPAAVDDALAALAWLSAWLGRFPEDHRRIFVAGDSAGANLATVTALDASATGAIAGQILFYPVTDCDFTTESYRQAHGIAPLSSEDMRWFWNFYCPDPALRTDHRASPLRHPALAALPPTFIAIAEVDPLRSENEAFARRLRSAQVDVEAHLYAGTTHGFFSSPDRLQPARDALADVRTFLDRILSRSVDPSIPQETLE